MSTDVTTKIQLLRLRDVQEVLSISRSSLYRLLDRGELPSVRIGAARRVTYTDLVAFLDARHPGKLLTP